MAVGLYFKLIEKINLLIFLNHSIRSHRQLTRIKKERNLIPPFRMLATCPEEIKPIVQSEIESLGFGPVEVLNKAVLFQVDEENFYKCHLKLSSVSQLFLVLRSFSAKTPEMIFSQAQRIPWTEVFDVKKSYCIQCLSDHRQRESKNSESSESKN